MGLPKKVRLREVGPREGFQTLPRVVPTERKLELINALAETGLTDIEVVSFVRPDKVPQMADAAEVVERLRPRPGVAYTGLYLNPSGFVRGEETGRLQNEGWLYLAASETFLKRNSNSSIAAGIAALPTWLAAFQERRKPLRGIMLSTAFGCNFEGPIGTDTVLSILKQVEHHVLAAGERLHEICLADTMGWASPRMLRERVVRVRGDFPGSEVSLHLHDTRGSGMANVYAGLEEGVSIFDCSIGGLGGCPFARGAAGNVPTEDVAFLCHELGVETGLDVAKLAQAAILAEEIVGEPLPGKFYKTWRAGCGDAGGASHHAPGTR